MNEELEVTVHGCDREAMLRDAHALATQYADEYVVLKVRAHTLDYGSPWDDTFELTMTVLVQA